MVFLSLLIPTIFTPTCIISFLLIYCGIRGLLGFEYEIGAHGRMAVAKVALQLWGLVYKMILRLW